MWLSVATSFNQKFTMIWLHPLFRTTWVLAVSCLLLPSANAGNNDPVPDFSLTDVNSTSSTFNQSVSPRDYLEHVSGWYFGHAT